MKKPSYKWLLFGGSLLIPVALLEAHAGGTPLGDDTTRVTAEAISQTPDGAPVEIGLLGYLFSRKRTEESERTTNGEQAPVGADVPQAYDGPLEELGLIDLLLGKEPQPLVMAAGIPVANEPVSEPVPLEDPIPAVGLINYLINRSNTATMSAAGPTQAVNRSLPTQATARSSVSPSRVPAKYATVVESAAISEDLLRIKVVLGQLPRSALAYLEQSAHLATTARTVNHEILIESTDPQPVLTQIHDSSDPAPAAKWEQKGLLELLLHRRPKAAVIAEPVVAYTEPQIEVAEKADSPESATPAEVEEVGLLELLLKRRPDAAGVEATKTPTGDEHLQHNRE